MKKILRFIRLKLAKRKRIKSKREERWSKLIQYDRKCTELRFELASPNRNVRYKKDYKINARKYQQMIYLTLEQKRIQNELRYD